MLGSGLIAWASALVVGLAATLASSAALAELRHIGTTPAYLDLDERFVESTEFPGYQVPQNALVQAFEFPDFMLSKLRDYAVDGIQRDWPNGKITSEAVSLGEREYTLVTIDNVDDGIPARTWLAIGGPEPTIQFHFMQLTSSGTIPVLNKELVLSLLKTAVYKVPSFDERMAAAGLSINAPSPFDYRQATTFGDTFAAALPTTPEFENSLSLGIFLEKVLPMPTLEDAGKDKLGGADWSKAEVASVTFAGTPGQRRSAAYEDDDGETVRVIQYATIVGDQVLSLTAAGKADEFGDGLVEIVDEMAASLRLGTAAGGKESK